MNTASLPPEMQEAYEKLQDQFGEEALDDELAEYVEEHPTLGATLRHPLVYSVFYTPPMNRQLNRLLHAKQEAIEKYSAKGNYESVVWLHERAYRLTAFTEIAHMLSDRRYWRLLGNIWTDSENICQDYEQWSEMLHSGRSRRTSMMDDEERAKLRELKQVKAPVLVYRGFSHTTSVRGLSWTLSRKTGEWFGRRFADEENTPKLAVGICDRRKIIAYFEGRGELEVVVLPENVIIERIEELR